MGAYLLAKDEVANYSGPDWAPMSLWAYANGLWESPQPGTADCARVLLESARAHDLWIALANRYDNPNRWASVIPSKCAEYMEAWRNLPKRTPSQHRDFYEELARRATQLSVEVARVFSEGYEDPEPGDPELVPVTILTLLSPDEIKRAQVRMCEYNYQMQKRGASIGLSDDELRKEYEASEWWRIDNQAMFDLWLFGDINGPGITPSLPEILNRVGRLLAIQAAEPILSKPFGENAERNYFTRRIVGMFEGEFAPVYPAIVARIVSMFYPQGISEGEVQQLRRVTARAQQREGGAND